MNVWKLCDVAQKGEKRMYIITATYTCVVTEFEYKHEQEMKKVAKWFAKQNERGDKDWRRREAEQPKKRGLSKDYVASQILKW